MLFARRHISRGRLGAAPRLSGQVSASQRIRWRPQLDWRGDDFRNAHDKGLHDAGMLQQDLLDLGVILTPPILIISLQPASKPSPSTGESEELNYRLLAKAGRDAEAERKGLHNFSSCCTPYCVKQTVGHKILIEITQASHERRWAKAGKRCDG